MRTGAYRLIEPVVPGLQPALAGPMALDHPEGWEIYRRSRESAKQLPQTHLFTDLTGVGNVEVAAVQRLWDGVVQESVRGGSGLVVSEALWKRNHSRSGARRRYSAARQGWKRWLPGMQIVTLRLGGVP